MYQQLKREIKDIVEIVNECPDNLKEKCFTLLLENYLLTFNSEKQTEVHLKKVPLVLESKSIDSEKKEQENQGTEDILEKDFHVKVVRFLKDNDISMAMVNNLYYKENGLLMPFYDTLKSTSMQECQIRIALLTAFENSFTSSNGEMTFVCDTVRNRCQMMKCYNASNYTTYFKNNKEYWESWPEKYDKDFVATLSSEGKKKLAEIIFDLAKDA